VELNDRAHVWGHHENDRAQRSLIISLFGFFNFSLVTATGHG
jgi:hypothetical protein